MTVTITTESIAALVALAADFDTLLIAPELLPEQAMPSAADLDIVISNAEALITAAEELERRINRDHPADSGHGQTEQQEASHG